MYYIALKMLMGDRGKYLGIILGISFAALIMTQQPSIFFGIMSRAYSFISDIDLPDIWVMDPQVKYIDDVTPMSSTKLYTVASVAGVSWAKPLYKGTIQAKLANGHFQTCNLIGIDDTTLIGGPGVMKSGALKDLRRAYSIIVDESGASDKLAYKNPDGSIRSLTVGDTLELNDNYSTIVGIAKTNPTFQSQPIIYTTYSRATTMIPQQRNVLSYILVKVKSGEDVDSIAKRIEKRTGLRALNKDEFKDLTLNYYLKYTGIPINFGTSVLLGFLVGAAIAGQTFYNFTQENLRYFGVLKAMGASQKTLVTMILLQALVVGVVGYGIGTFFTFIFYLFTTRHALLAFKFPPELMIFSIIGVAFICTIAALISARKVIKLEAAVVFQGG